TSLKNRRFEAGQPTYRRFGDQAYNFLYPPETYQSDPFNPKFHQESKSGLRFAKFR
ncbi:hypothetical protein TNCV_4501781, partial [Trichonephila clavipes]